MLIEHFLGGFDCPVCPNPSYGPNSIYTRTLYKTVDLLMLDHSIEFYCILDSSAKPALMKAIASLQQSTHKAKCTL